MTDFNTNARYKRINEIQARNHSTLLDPYYSRNTSKDRYVLKSLLLIASVGFLSMGFTMAFKSCVSDYKNLPKQLDCVKCHSLKVKMTEYFKKNDVKSPQEMAEAVLKTKNPRLLAAWNVGGEKKTPHTAMKTGFKKRYSGAWQTEDTWGKITKRTSITDQALIAELALNTHVKEEKDIIKGLNALGGESDKKHGKFAYNVLSELTRVP